VTIEPQKVADYLGLAYPDDRVTAATVAAQRWVEKRRCLTDPIDLWIEPDVVLGTLILASLFYQQRAQPQGFPGIDDLGNFSDDVGNAWANIYRLVGQDPVVA
jgi:hypothetical protein